MTTHTVPETYTYACEVTDLPTRGKKTLTLGGKRIILIACDEAIYAVEDSGEDARRSLAHGKVLNHTLTMPGSGARYDLRTGLYLGGSFSTPSHTMLRVLPVHVASGKVYLHV